MKLPFLFFLLHFFYRRFKGLRSSSETAKWFCFPFLTAFYKIRLTFSFTGRQIGHFRVPLSLSFKASRAKFLLW